MDRYGDSYTKEATVESLKHCFGILERLKEQPGFSGMISMQHGKNFDKYKAYFDKFSSVNDASSNVIYDSLEDELEFRYYYGMVCQSVGPETNLVIVMNSDRKNYIRNYLKSISRDYIEIRERNFIYD